MWTGVLAVVVGMLSVLPSVTSAGPTQGAASSPHRITPTEAEELIARYRATITPEALRGHFIYRSAFDALLAQPEAAGIRIYFGRYEDGAETFVLYAINAQGRDLTQVPANTVHPIPPFSAISESETLTRQLALKGAVAMHSHLVSQEQAQESIARFQESATPGTVLSYTLERSAFDELLAQPDAHGIRVHYAMDADGARTLVLYGTDSLYRDLKQMPMGRARSEPPLAGARTRP
jgi:hypothetical protein